MRLGQFKKVKAGEWQQPVMRGYLMECCDCGLVHRVDFMVRIDGRGRARVLLRAWRAGIRKAKRAALRRELEKLEARKW